MPGLTYIKRTSTFLLRHYLDVVGNDMPPDALSERPPKLVCHHCTFIGVSLGALLYHQEREHSGLEKGENRGMYEGIR